MFFTFCRNAKAYAAFRKIDRGVRGLVTSWVGPRGVGGVRGLVTLVTFGDKEGGGPKWSKFF